MGKSYLVLVGLIVVFSLVILDNSYSAQSNNESDDKNVSQEKAVNVGNKICPVSGDKINEKTKATYEYKGRVYNFCCPACIEEFKKYPEKYIKKIEDELQQNTEEKIKPAPHMQMNREEEQ